MLKLPFPIKKREAPWNAHTDGGGEGKVSSTKTVWTLRYAPGKVGAESGFTVHAAPSKIFPGQDIELKYNVLFRKGWQWKEGGKLPGLVLGDGASGGDWSKDGGSVRVIFKEGGKCCGYLYIPLQVASRKDMENVQPSEYAKVVHHTNKGDHIWRDGVGEALKIGEWNEISVRVKLNTPTRDKKTTDGFVRLTVNGHSETLPLLFRAEKSLAIEGLCWASFFGGSSDDARAPSGAIADFKDVSVVTLQQQQ